MHTYDNRVDVVYATAACMHYPPFRFHEEFVWINAYMGAYLGKGTYWQFFMS